MSHDEAYDTSVDVAQVRKGANTIDILEDCLQQIYEARKANLMAKQAKNAKQLQRRQLRLSRLSRPKTPLQGDQEAFFDEGIGDEGELDNGGGVMDLMASAQDYDRDIPDPDTAFGAQFKNDMNERTASSKGRLDIGTFATLDEKKNDLAAATFFEEFKTELCTWWANNNLKHSDEDARTDLADFLTEKYMSKKLDPLPPSKIVSNTRKRMMEIIEELAKPGLLPHDFTDVVFKKKEDQEFLDENKELNANNMTKKNALLTSAEYQQKLNADELKGEIKARTVQKKATPSEARDLEKKKIKEQYETYMRYKKQAEQGAIETQAQQAQADAVMSLADDIQSLLGSVQKSNNDMASKELDAKVREERKNKKK